MKILRMLRLSFPAATVASLCCLSPLVLVLLGASASSFGVTLFTRTLGPYEWVFFSTGAAFLVASLIAHFRAQNICTLDQARARQKEVVKTTTLVLVVALIVFGVIFGSVALAGRSLRLWSF